MVRKKLTFQILLKISVNCLLQIATGMIIFTTDNLIFIVICLFLYINTLLTKFHCLIKNERLKKTKLNILHYRDQF